MEQPKRELWVMGLGDRKERGALVCSYLAEVGYFGRTADIVELNERKPLGIVIDVSPHSTDGWGLILSVKSHPEWRKIPILPVFLSEKGKVGGVFPVAGFFTAPIDPDHVEERLTVLGLTRDVEDYHLQALVVTRRGDELLATTLQRIGFDVVNAYTGHEAVALAMTGHPYLAFAAMMLPDMGSFELLQHLDANPQTRNIPLFVLLKGDMKEGERLAMSREIEHLVRKRELSRKEFLSCFRRH
ncbi:MAG: response regulator [Desulfuromonadia bacterium]